MFIICYLCGESRWIYKFHSASVPFPTPALSIPLTYIPLPKSI